jgi:hypothetical protein
VITNERQYPIANAEARKFEQAVAAARATGPSPGVHPRVHEAMVRRWRASTPSSARSSTATRRSGRAR